MRDWINTYTGRKFRPLDPDPEDIFIEDIAHALSLTNRYTGHTDKAYSVAEHSVLVSEIVPQPLRLIALLHDASEAYLCDIATPVKMHPSMQGYRVAETLLQEMIWDKFCPNWRLQDLTELWEIDKDMVSSEARQLITNRHPEFILPPPKYPIKVQGYSPRVIEAEFLQMFDTLTSERFDDSLVYSSYAGDRVHTTFKYV